MTDMHPLLIELGTEELPVKALPGLAQAFFDGVIAALDKRGALRFHTCDGMHMQLSPACKELVFGQYVGRPRSPGRWLAMNA